MNFANVSLTLLCNLACISAARRLGHVVHLRSVQPRWIATQETLRAVLVVTLPRRAFDGGAFRRIKLEQVTRGESAFAVLEIPALHRHLHGRRLLPIEGGRIASGRIV